MGNAVGKAKLVLELTIWSSALLPLIRNTKTPDRPLTVPPIKYVPGPLDEELDDEFKDEPELLLDEVELLELDELELLLELLVDELTPLETDELTLLGIDELELLLDEPRLLTLDALLRDELLLTAIELLPALSPPPPPLQAASIALTTLISRKRPMNPNRSMLAVPIFVNGQLWRWRQKRRFSKHMENYEAFHLFPAPQRF